METLTLSRKVNANNLVLPDPGEISRGVLSDAKAVWADYRAAEGFLRVPTPYGTSPADNFKFAKSKSLIYGLSLAQSRLSGINVCRWSTPVCVQCCVAGAGNGAYPAVVRARVAKTKFLFGAPDAAAVLLADFHGQAVKKGCIAGKAVGSRPNTFSDLDWQSAAPWLFETFPTINFFDYTKDWSRVSRFPNYSLTYSVSEKTKQPAIEMKLSQGRNVAIVFDTPRSKALPSGYHGFFGWYPILNGDASDERWLDPKGVVVGLRAKGRMRTAGKGMVYNGSGN